MYILFFVQVDPRGIFLSQLLFMVFAIPIFCRPTVQKSLLSDVTSLLNMS